MKKMNNEKPTATQTTPEDKTETNVWDNGGDEPN